MASRRAYADEYAVRVNRAVELLAGRSPADAVRALQVEHVLYAPLAPIDGDPYGLHGTHGK